MKILSSMILAVALLTAPMTMVTGCKSTPQQIAYKSLKSVQVASVAALHVYGAAYRRGEIDADTKAKVHDLYARYQKAWSLAATAAQFNYSSPSTPELTAAVGELVEFIQTLRK